MKNALTKDTVTRALETVTSERTIGERNFDLAQREAKALSQSTLVPKEYSGNVANCLIAMNLAKRIGVDPLMVIQNLDVIHGRPSFRASFLIACVNMCGRFTPLQYRMEGTGDAQRCTAYASDKATGDLIEGPPVSMEMARAEGWSTKAGSKWKTMPDLMLRYRAAAFFARTVAPEITLGLHTTDEYDDMRPASRDTRPSAVAAVAALEEALEDDAIEAEVMRDDE